MFFGILREVRTPLKDERSVHEDFAHFVNGACCRREDKEAKVDVCLTHFHLLGVSRTGEIAPPLACASAARQLG